VSPRYPGASAEVIESQVTKPLEDSIAGIEGVELLTSISRSERSQINVRFRLSKRPRFRRRRGARPRGARAQPPAGNVDEPVIARSRPTPSRDLDGLHQRAARRRSR
jgi:multidrug efflux pump